MSPTATAQVREWLDTMGPTTTPDWYLMVEAGAPTVDEAAFCSCLRPCNPDGSHVEAVR